MQVKTFHPENNPFKVLYADLTHRCQMNCANCYLPNRTIPDMDISAFFACLKKLPHKTDIRLIGGEPTLRLDIFEIISEVVKLGHRPILITNGLKLADSNFVFQLKKAGLKYAQVSLNGFNDDSIYKMIDKMNCAVQKMTAIENCKKLGIATSLSCILVRDLNTHLVPELIKFADTLKKPARINFRNVGAIGRNTSIEHPTLSLNEMVDLVSGALRVTPSEIHSSRVTDNQIRYLCSSGSRYSQKTIIKITDWSIFQKSNLVDPNRHLRGRITQDFTLAPHFEHVKENEFGY